MWRKNRIVALALAVMLALAPATPRAEVETRTATPNGAGTALRYVACAGSIVFMIAVPASVFYTTLVCIHAFLASED